MMDQPPRIGRLRAGPRDAITDVAGVTVGHATLSDGAVQTGVTVIHPHGRDPFLHKAPAATAVINGFGKSVGLLQLEELGQLETPIALTNTFSVPTVAQAQIARCIAANPEVGRAWSTVNPLVLECNDGYLNDIQRMAVTGAHYDAACAGAGPDMAQGAVGAGRGMSSFRLKGGIGTASRRAVLAGGAAYTVGALVLANYGVQANLLWGGQPLGERLAAAPARPEAEKGSIIMVLATDAPLDARQLKRLALRAAAGLARTGSVYGHGSGDIALAFSTAYTLPQLPTEPMPAVAMVHEALLDPLFQAGADGVEQAIVHALWHAESVTGRDGHRRAALRDLLKNLP
ncbi:MAG: P1 family peptidase [Proteobacteria bacterium]|nr:P1 family peptidase [Pseudomonadota bacterium]